MSDASSRVIYLLQEGGARFHKTIRAIQKDCPPEIALRIEKALANNTIPSEAVDPQITALTNKNAELREALVEIAAIIPKAEPNFTRRVWEIASRALMVADNKGNDNE